VPESADHVAEVKALINDQTPRQKAVARRIAEPPLPVAQAVMMEAPPQINITIAPSLIVETTRVRRVGEASASRFEITITVALSGRQE
jgi:hypothetical protein